MKIKFTHMLAIAFSGILIGMTVNAQAGDLYVDDDGICGLNLPCYFVIQEAVNDASPSDTVHVYEGTYGENITIGKSLTLLGENRETTIIDGGGSGDVIRITSHIVAISGLKVTNGLNGISAAGGMQEITIRDVIVDSNSKSGLGSGSGTIDYGWNWLIEDSIISNNGFHGLFWFRFGNSIIRNCEIFGNGNDGIELAYDSYTLVSRNYIHNNNDVGIHLDGTNYVNTEGNLLWNNYVGIIPETSARNTTIKDNIFYHNTGGIGMKYYWPYFWNNKVYHNDFIENTNQAGDYYTSSIWDDGYPSGGNYWSDYAGADNYGGPGQNLPGSDGIGDTPYIFINAQDNYPRMRPSFPIDIKPETDKNSINPRNKGVIPVCIFGTDLLDVTDVDVNTLRFGSSLASLGSMESLAMPAHDLTDPSVYADHLQDIDLDGHMDLVTHYSIQETGIACGDTSAELFGKIINGKFFRGVDSITIMGCK